MTSIARKHKHAAKNCPEVANTRWGAVKDANDQRMRRKDTATERASFYIDEVVVDRLGRIIEARFDDGDRTPSSVIAHVDTLEVNYFSYLASWMSGERATVQADLEGIRSVAEGLRSRYQAEVKSDSAGVVRRMELRAYHLGGHEGGALIQHLEVIQTSRVAALREMIAVLIHELNQPLAATLSNAEAAQRFLCRPDPNLGEVEAALCDICADARRAAAASLEIRSKLRSGVSHLSAGGETTNSRENMK